jgi:uncharacterized protein (TIGR02118 family)
VYKLYALWSAPKAEDIEEFERLYTERHAALAAAVPGIRRLIVSRTDTGLEGAEPACYRVAEMIFDSQEALEQGEHSEEWQRVREDAGALIERFGVTLSVAIGEETEHSLGG